MGVFEILEQNDRRVEEATKAWLGPRFVALEQPFDTLSKLFGAVQARPKTQFPDGPFQAALLYARITQHLWTAWRLALSGHYIDAINTLKIVNECSLLALLLARDDDAARRWEQGENGFRPVEVRAALSRHLAQEEAQAKPLAKELGKSYALVCEVAHPNSTSIEWIRNGLRSFSNTGSFEEARCAAVMVRMLDEFALVIPGFASLVLDAGCDVPRDHIAELLQVLNRVRGDLEPRQAGTSA